MIQSCSAIFQRGSARFLIFSLLWVSPAYASERAHEHGVGELTIAVEGHDVEIELTVPGADVVGFEHFPSSKAEREAVISGAEILQDASNIIRLSAEAKCKIEDIKVTSGLMEPGKDNQGHSHEHETKKKDEDDHDHKHEANKKEKHDHGHKHEAGTKDSDAEVHAEFIAHYHFHCDNLKKLIGAEIGFFTVFPSAHELEAKWITPKGQGAAELTAKSSRLSF